MTPAPCVACGTTDSHSALSPWCQDCAELTPFERQALWLAHIWCPEQTNTTYDEAA